MKTNAKKRVWKRRLRNRKWAGRHLTRALNQSEPEEVQGALYDVIKAQGTLEKVAAKSGLSEWRIKLMLYDDEEAWKLVRLASVLWGMGLKLVVKS